MDSTQFLAWWGGIVATIVLLWDIVKWFRSKAIIRFIAKPNVFYSDAEVVKEEVTNNGISRQLKTYIHIELVNSGSMPTTIMRIEANRKWKGGSVHQTGPAFKEHFQNKLPYVLRPGEVWSCRIDQQCLFDLPGKGPLNIEVVASHKKRPLIQKLRMPKEVEQRAD